jgi:inner membrane protein
MDSLTHIALGACIGEVIAGKPLGKKALIIGAIANSLPDIDIVASFFLPLTADLLAHRGFTHSFLFLLLATPLLAFMSQRLFRSSAISMQKWLLFWSLQLFVHIFIDAFNSYGTGWFEPFSHMRVSFNTMFVADPLFTLWPLGATIVLIVRKSNANNRTLLPKIALSLSFIYLMCGIAFKNVVDGQVHTDMKQKGIVPEKYFSTPTPLNNLLWYVVTKSDSGFFIGYRSLFDGEKSTSFRYVCQNAPLLRTATRRDDIDRLVRFSQGYYTAEIRNDSLVFNDLRFGEITGWADSTPRCVFYYYAGAPEANDLIVQRGRFANWDAQALIAFVRRIGGN